MKTFAKAFFSTVVIVLTAVLFLSLANGKNIFTDASGCLNSAKSQIQSAFSALAGKNFLAELSLLFSNGSNGSQSESAGQDIAADSGSFWGDTGMPGLTVYEYGKSLLNSGEKACYSQIAQALKNVSPSVTVKTNITPETFEKIYQYYLYDHTEIFYLKNSTMKYDYLTVVGKKTYNSYTLTFRYRYNGKTVAAMRKAMRQGALEMLASAESKSSALGKEKALHDTLVATCSYDSSAQTNKDLNSVSYTAYGIFVNKKAVCDGYARALKILLSSAGIKSAYVTGTASNSAGEWEDHGWDMAYVSGRWYYVDATFDDPVYVDSQGREISGSGDRVSYSYFNFSSKSDHVLGKFNGSNPFDDNSQNYETMP